MGLTYIFRGFHTRATVPLNQLSLQRYRASAADPSRCSGSNNFLSQEMVSRATTTTCVEALKSHCEECAALDAILKTFGGLRSATTDLVIYEDSIGFPDEQQQQRELELVRLSDDANLSEANNTQKELLGDTGSDEAVRWARERLHEYGDKALHPSCKPMLDTLLQIRIVQIVAPEEIGLHINSSHETGSYCVLSHCWGTRPLLQTLCCT